MATIEDLNKNYSKEKNVLEKLTAPGGLKDKIDQFQADLDLTIMNFKITEANMKYAESRNDKTLAATLKKDLEYLGKSIVTQRAKLDRASNFLVNQQQLVNEKIADFNKNPEIKQKT